MAIDIGGNVSECIVFVRNCSMGRKNASHRCRIGVGMNRCKPLSAVQRSGYRAI